MLYYSSGEEILNKFILNLGLIKYFFCADYRTSLERPPQLQTTNDHQPLKRWNIFAQTMETEVFLHYWNSFQ